MSTERKRSKRDGYVLPAVVIFIVFSVLVGMAVLELGTIEQVEAAQRGRRESAFYLAEAGAERAMAFLKWDRDWQPEQDALPLGDGVFSVTREDIDNTIVLESTGSAGQVSERVRVVLKIAHIWSEGIFAREAVLLAQNAGIASYDASQWFDHYGEKGHTGSLNLISIAGTAWLKGNASVTPEGEIINPERATGLINENTRFPDSLVNMPDVVIPQELLDMDYTTPADLEGYSFDEAKDFELTDGELVIIGNSTVTLGAGSYRFKSIRIGGSAQLIIDDDADLYVEDELRMHGTPQWKMRGLTNLYLGDDSQMRLDGNTEIVVFALVTTEEGEEEIMSADPTSFRIFSTSDREPAIRFGNAPDKDGVVGTVGLFYAPHGTVDLTNNTDFYGAITANKITVGNRSNIYYDENLMKADLDVPGELYIVRWHKPAWEDRF